jgi:MoxR-like ATPase
MKLDELKSKVGQVVELKGKVGRVWFKNGSFALKLDLGDGQELFVRFPKDTFQNQESLSYEFAVGENVTLVGTLSWSINKNTGDKVLVLDVNSYKKAKLDNNEEVLNGDNLKELAEKESEYYNDILNKDFNPYEVISAIRELEGKINKVVKNREEMVRLLINSSIYGANTLLVGGVGVAKTMTTELVSHMFSDRVLYYQFSRNTEMDSVIGYINLNELKRGILRYETERFLNADFHIYDEFFQTHGRIRAALNDYLVRRVITVDQRGVLDGKTRAIFSTANFLTDLTKPEVRETGDYAIADRFHVVYNVPKLSVEEKKGVIKSGWKEKLASSRTINNLKKELSELRKSKGISVENLEQLKAYAISNVRVPEWVFDTIVLFAERAEFYLGRYYAPSIRKSLHLLGLMAVNAVLEGRNVILPKDVELILSNTLFIDEDMMKKLANRSHKPIVDKAHIFYEAFSNVDLDDASLKDKKKNIGTMSDYVGVILVANDLVRAGLDGIEVVNKLKEYYGEDVLDKFRKDIVEKFMNGNKAVVSDLLQKISSTNINTQESPMFGFVKDANETLENIDLDGLFNTVANGFSISKDAVKNDADNLEEEQTNRSRSWRRKL